MTLPTGRFKVCTAETLGRDRGPHKLHPQTSDTPPPRPSPLASPSGVEVAVSQCKEETALASALASLVARSPQRVALARDQVT